MTVAAQNVAPQAVAAAGQLIFPFAWRCDDATTVKVYVNDVQDGGFNVILNVDQIAAPGGTITRAVACLGGEVVTVERTSPQAQTVALGRYGAFQAVTLSNFMDQIYMLAQETASIAGKALRAARSSLAQFASFELPTPTNKSLLQWQADAITGLYRLGNVDSATALAGGLSEVTGEAVNRTGVGTYQLAHTPNPLSKVKVYLNGGRLTKTTHYTISALGLITQQAGFVSDPAEVMLADYTW